MFKFLMMFISVISLSKAAEVFNERLPNVTYPKDTTIFRPKGSMFLTLNYGHIRTSINISAMQIAKETACDSKIQAINMINYILSAKDQRGSNLTIGTTRSTGELKINSKVLEDTKQKARQNKKIQQLA